MAGNRKVWYLIMKEVILFDLDGTIVNSQLGVTTCVQYALRHIGIDEPDLEKLRVFIGPPLRGAFMKAYGLSSEQAEEVIAKYRERYNVVGIYESELYPHVEETFKNLKEKGYILAVASSKPEKACREMLTHFGVAHYFETIGGATFDGKISEKADVLKMVMERLKVREVEKVLLIGDTKYDAMGAAQVSMDCVGITYGFGSKEDLLQAGVTHVCDSLKEVEEYLERQ